MSAQSPLNSADADWDNALDGAFSKGKDLSYSDISEYTHEELSIIKSKKWSCSFIKP